MIFVVNVWFTKLNKCLIKLNKRLIKLNRRLIRDCQRVAFPVPFNCDVVTAVVIEFGSRVVCSLGGCYSQLLTNMLDTKFSLLAP